MARGASGEKRSVTAPNRIHGWLVGRPADATRLQLLTLAVGEDPALVQEWMQEDIIPSAEDAFTAAARVIDTAQQECDAQAVKCKFALRWTDAEGRSRGQTVIKCMPQSTAELDGPGEPEPSSQGIVELVLRHKENDHRQVHVAWMGAQQTSRELVGQVMEQNRMLFGELGKVREERALLLTQTIQLVQLVREMLDEKREKRQLEAGMTDPRIEAQALAITELASGVREHLLPAAAAPLTRLLESAGTALARSGAPKPPKPKPPAANGKAGNGAPPRGQGVGN